MDDPELKSDETVLVRTPGVFVKSIPFEGILTDKRIILVDRAKNLLPPKEIPLATIKELQSGENAIRDQTITLSVLAKNNATRQVILTFSRVSGGNRIKERDEWVRQIRDHSPSTFGQAIRKAIPGREPAPQKKTGAPSPKIEIVNSPVVVPRPVKTESGNVPTGIASQEISSPSPQPPVASQLSFGTFCTRCGNRVPDGSAFCNKCGTRIVTPVDSAPAPAMPQVPGSQPAPVSAVPTKKGRSIDREIQSIDPLTERSAIKIPADPLRAAAPAQVPVSPQTPPPLVPPLVLSQPEKPEPVPIALPETPQPPQVVPAPAPALPRKKPAPRRFIPRLFSSKDLPPTPLVPGSMPTAAPPKPPKPRRGKGKLIATAVIVIIIIAVVAGVFIFLKPNIGAGTSASTPSPSGTQAPAGTASATQTAGPAVTIARAETTSATIPSDGVYVHVNYIGSWKGTYGLSNALQPMTSSGDRLVNVENATGVIQASFAKQDGSSHEILVEIYKGGKQLTKGVTSAPNGKVTLSVDTTTGVAQTPVISGNSGAVVTTTSPQGTATTTQTVKITTSPTTAP